VVQEADDERDGPDRKPCKRGSEDDLDQLMSAML
jgi:hypothetical protein